MTCQSLACVGLFIITVSLQAIAQPKNREIVNQSTEWFSAASNIKVTNRLTFIVEGQFRYVQHLEPLQYQARTAVEVKINDHFSFVPLGYVFTWNYRYGKQPAMYENDEHRMWQQVMYKHSFRRAKMDHRFRFEERFIQHHSTNAEGVISNDGFSNKQFRVRYRFMTRIPLNKPAIESGSYYLSIYDEAFISWGKTVTFHEPDQNRIFTGIGYQVDSRLGLQAGFLYQMLIKSNGAKQENNLGLQVMLNYNIDLSKN